MTVAVIDRLVHHAVVIEMSVESYRQRSAANRKGRATAVKKVDLLKETQAAKLT